MLDRAGYCVSGHLGAQWVGRAIQLMTEELPPTMVHPDRRAGIYNNYGCFLRQLEQHSNAIEAYHEAVSIRRILVADNPTKYNLSLARTLMNLGISLWNVGKDDDAIVAYKEVLEICTAMSAQDLLQYSELMALTLLQYGILLLVTLKQVSEAAAVQKQAVSLLRNLAQAGSECTKLLCDALYSYGRSCDLLEEHTEAVLAYQESISLRRALVATDPEEERLLIVSLHDIVPSFIAIGRHAEANTATTEALEINRGRVFESCPCALNFQVCHRYQRAVIAHLLGAGFQPHFLFPANPLPRLMGAFWSWCFPFPSRDFHQCHQCHLGPYSSYKYSTSIRAQSTRSGIRNSRSYLSESHRPFPFISAFQPTSFPRTGESQHTYPNAHWRGCGGTCI